MPSIATPAFLRELGENMSLNVPLLARESPANGEWTWAVYRALETFAASRKWLLFPKEKPCKGEYLCDFMLFEEGYGCRVACESQWAYWNGDCHWAFDKLKGVKADVKLFICESTVQNLEKVRTEHLLNYAQLSPEEGFVTLRWQKPTFERAWWIPQSSGPQSGVSFISF